MKLKIYFYSLLLIYLTGCSPKSESGLLVDSALNISDLPVSVRILKSNWLTGWVYKTYEYHLDISPSDYTELLSGQHYIDCAKTQVESAKAFILFQDDENVYLTHCVKHMSPELNVAVYNDSDMRNVFVVFDIH